MNSFDVANSIYMRQHELSCISCFLKKLWNNFDYQARETLTSVLNLLCVLAMCFSGVFSSIESLQFVTAALGVASVFFCTMSSTINLLPVSYHKRGKAIRRGLTKQYRTKNSVSLGIMRARVRSNDRSKRSATRTSSTNVGGNSTDEEGSSSDGNGLGHRVPNFLSYFLKSNKVNFTNRFLHPYSLRAYGSIYVRCCQRLGMVVA